MVQRVPKPTTLVTGATGFIGSHLVRRLVHEGWRVHTLVRPGSDGSCWGEAANAVEIHTYEGHTEDVMRAVQSAAPDIVFHLAGRISPQEEKQDVEPLVLSNVLIGTQLLMAMRLHQIPFLVNTGTVAQWHENRARVPRNLYGATKQAMEDIISYFSEVYGVSCVTLQLCTTYGPGDTNNKLIPLLHDGMRNQTPVAFSPGGQYLCMLHVNDVVDAFCIAANRLFKGKTQGHDVCQIYADDPMTLREFVALVERITGAKITVKWGGVPYRAREMMEPPCIVSPLPGWRQKISLEHGMREMFQ